MAEIKGTVLLDTITSVKTRAGQAELDKIINALSPQARSIFAQPLHPSSWYPLDAFVEFLETDIRETAGGSRDVLIQRSERVIERQLQGIYKIFVKFGSPGFVITRISAVHTTYFRGIQIIPEIEKHSANIKYVGFQKHHSIMECPILGFFRKALEISGARQVTLNFTSPIAEGGRYCELLINWA